MPLSPHTRFDIAKEKLWKSMALRDRRVLMAILAHGSDNPLIVSDVIIIPALGSQATIHHSLMSLVKSEHLKFSSSSEFGRSKFISLTNKSNILFKKLNKLFLACAMKHRTNNDF